jgi:hypothetical protein
LPNTVTHRECYVTETRVGGIEGSSNAATSSRGQPASKRESNVEQQRKANQQDEQKFAEMMARLLEPAKWGEKQQMELEMARDAASEMLRLAESMRANQGDLSSSLQLLKYAKVVDFVLTTLAAGRDIKPATLRVIFKLAGLPIDEAYPG